MDQKVLLLLTDSSHRHEKGLLQETRSFLLPPSRLPPHSLVSPVPIIAMCVSPDAGERDGKSEH